MAALLLFLYDNRLATEMEFRTCVDIGEGEVMINHNTEMMMLGSCFSEEIGRKLLDHKFRVEINPFGILYNPFSVSEALKRLISGNPFSESDLFLYNGMYHSPMHHGVFSSPRLEESLHLINNRFEKAVALLPLTDLLMVTFGTSWIYRRKDDDKIVANCHKLPANQFERTRLSLEEITLEWQILIKRLIQLNPRMKLLFTVSPVRHMKDGAHENQLSKATLQLAIERLQVLFPKQIFYFPAYEIMIDELRDYRFYGDDMLHPTSLAVNYIWEKFSLFCFSHETEEVNREWSVIRQALEHRPLHPDSEAFYRFRQQTEDKLEAFARCHPSISCDEERKKLNL